ncbi:Predicted membrane protein [Chryseobacterium nakagawai]|nr:Predicted membrane protein [Chryseobacterium nakagawai]
MINVWLLTNSFDPFPFILLNLILSCLAAIQAPIIMMSQNRQEQKDRLRGEHDYKINLKAELEIKLLSEKIDHLLVNQNKKLLEIQDIQTDYLEDLMKEIKRKS